MNTFLNKQRVWLLPAVLILFILEVITFPFVISFTWADRSENPKHVLTYTQGKLTWNNAEKIDENGVAELSLFDTAYLDVDSEERDNVIAPGTRGNSIVRLKNSVGKSIGYTAVLYSTKSVEELPIEASLSGDNFTDTDKYSLPEGVNRSDVIRAVSGTLGGGMIQDFDIGWRWDYYDDKVQDIIDTLFGDKVADHRADDITVGIYIVVEDGNSYISPSTGADPYSTGVGIYIALMCISAFILILLIFEKRRNKKCEE